MSGQAAVAEALLKAGNLDGAEREALALLERDPHDRTGVEVLISVFLEKGYYKRALALAEDWVAREPDWAQAHFQRFVCLAKAKKKRRARKAMERFRVDFPHEPIAYDGMWIIMQTAFGNSEAIVRRMDGLRQEYDDELALDEIEAMAKNRAGHLIGAFRAADRVLEKDPLDTTALGIKAANAFKLCRFSKARALARELRRLEPRKATWANELIYASYAVYFPPFLTAHFLMMLTALATSRLPVIVAPIVYLVGAPLIALPLVVLVETLADATAIPNFENIFLLSMVAWCIYKMFIFQRLKGRRKSAKSVALSRDY